MILSKLTSTLKWLASPRDTPAIFLPSLGRTSCLMCPSPLSPQWMVHPDLSLVPSDPDPAPIGS